MYVFGHLHAKTPTTTWLLGIEFLNVEDYLSSAERLQGGDLCTRFGLGVVNRLLSISSPLSLAGPSRTPSNAGRPRSSKTQQST